MDVSPLNSTLAANLRALMDKHGLTQKELSAKCGVAQTTISLYLNPDRRKPGKDGKPGSAKLTEVEMLANAFNAQPWELLRPLTPTERSAYEKIEAAFRELKQPSVDTTATAPAPQKHALAR